MELYRSTRRNPVFAPFFAFLLALALSTPARALMVGPVNSLPGGFTFDQTGVSGDTLIGRASGKEIHHFNMQLANLTTVYLVIQFEGVKGSMDGTDYTGAEIMTLVGVSSNNATWTGSTTIINAISGLPASVTTQFDTLGTDYVSTTGVTAIATSAITDIPDGGAAYIVPAAGINLWMQMLGNGTPFYDYYDAYPTNGGGAGTSVNWEFYYVNIPPTISDIADQVTAEGTSSGPHDFTVDDVEMGLDANLDSLLVTATSSHQTLVPDASITLGGSGGSRTITLIPAAGQYGTATITVTVTDENGESASDTFALVVNAPPLLTANNPLNLDRGTTAVIDDTLLAATDDLSPPENLSYSFGDVGATPRNGVLLLDGTPLNSADTFTQADIDANLLSYAHDDSCNLSDDFTFDVTDEHGGMAPPPPHTTYTFGITVNDPNRPPVAVDDSLAVAIGAATDGVLQATDDNCTTPTFTFGIETQPARGVVVLNDANLGTYTYTPNAGEVGLDSFTFQVSDGVAQAAVEGTISIEISNTAPTPDDSFGETGEDIPYSGTLTATDPDLPPQTLTYSIDTNGAKGTAVMDDATAGTFTYTPAPGAIGSDSFTFIVNDGIDDSPAGTFGMEIRPKLEFGDLIVSDGQAAALILVDPSTGHQALLSQDGDLVEPHGITLQSNGMILVADAAGTVVQVDPVDGSQTVLIGGLSGVVVDVAVDDAGAIYVSNGPNGVLKFDAAGTPLDVFSGGDLDFAAGLDVVGTDLYVASAGAFVGVSNKLVRIDLNTGAQTLVSVDDLLSFPVGMEHNPAETPFSNLYIANAGPVAGLPDSNVITIDAVSGTQSMFSFDPLVSSVIDVTFNLAGTAYAVNILEGSVISINSVGDPTLVSTGEHFIQPWAIEVINSYRSVCNLGPLVIESGLFDADLGAVELASEDSIIVRGADVLSLADVILRAPWISFETGYQFVTEGGATFNAIAESVDCAARALAHERTPTLPQATEVRE